MKVDLYSTTPIFQQVKIVFTLDEHHNQNLISPPCAFSIASFKTKTSKLYINNFIINKWQLSCDVVT